MAELSAKQKRFCLEYIKDSNATQAAVRAGYSKHAAKQQGTRLLSYASIKQELRILSAKIETSKIMSATETLQFLTDIAKAPKEKTSDRLTAANLLGKHHKLFTEMHETQHTFTQMPSIKRNGKAVQFEVGSPKPDR